MSQSGKTSPIRVRSGSPGNRNNVDKLINLSLKSTDPKEFLKVNFNTEMKKTGLSKELKNIKSNKLNLMRRSAEVVDTIDPYNQAMPGGTITESESTTLDRNGQTL